MKNVRFGAERLGFYSGTGHTNGQVISKLAFAIPACARYGEKHEG